MDVNRISMGDRPIEFPPGIAIDFFLDEERHEITPITKGPRIVFSIGCWQ